MSDWPQLRERLIAELDKHKGEPMPTERQRLFQDGPVPPAQSWSELIVGWLEPILKDDPE